MNTDRIYQDEDDRWYFNVRGNLAKGPYVSYPEAEDALSLGAVERAGAGLQGAVSLAGENRRTGEQHGARRLLSARRARAVSRRRRIQRAQPHG